METFLREGDSRAGELMRCPLQGFQRGELGLSWILANHFHVTAKNTQELLTRQL